MALKAEVLKADKALADLTDDQIAAIETLSSNDETSVVSKAIGDLHQQYDDDIKAVTGQEKAQGVKSYDHLKSVLTGLKEGAEGAEALQSKITEHETTIEEMKQKIADGKGNETLGKELKDTQDELKALKAKAVIDTESWSTERAQLEKQNADMKVGHSFSSALGDLKFKPEYPDNVKDILVKTAQSNILNKLKPDWDENGTLIFRDDKGEIARNSENGLKPFTAQELMSTELKDSLDLGKQQAGTGTGAPGSGSGSAAVDISSARTQVEADDMIERELMSQGLTKDNPDFVSRSMEMRTASNVADLPIK